MNTGNTKCGRTKQVSEYELIILHETIRTLRRQVAEQEMRIKKIEEVVDIILGVDIKNDGVQTSS